VLEGARRITDKCKKNVFVLYNGSKKTVIIPRKILEAKVK